MILATILASLMTIPTYCKPDFTDFNNDGEVNVTDLLMVLSDWGQEITVTYPPVTGYPVGQPTYVDCCHRGDVETLILLLEQWGTEPDYNHIWPWQKGGPQVYTYQCCPAGDE